MYMKGNINYVSSHWLLNKQDMKKNNKQVVYVFHCVIEISYLWQVTQIFDRWKLYMTDGNQQEYKTGASGICDKWQPHIWQIEAICDRQHQCMTDDKNIRQVIAICDRPNKSESGEWRHHFKPMASLFYRWHHCLTDDVIRCQIMIDVDSESLCSKFLFGHIILQYFNH
jgi:hypothetical protein